jgi:Kef-type K+ transport system membrane component KefB
MDFQDAYRRIQGGVTGDGPLSRIGPLTLLSGCGILLAAALLIVTGLVVGYLHARTLEASEAGLSRVGAVLVGTGNRSLLAVEAVLSDIASHIRIADTPDPDSAARDIA